MKLPNVLNQVTRSGIFGLIAFLSLLLSGCGGGGGGGEPPQATYTVGVTVTGLAGTGLVLQDNGADDLAVSANGAFTFATHVADGAGYSVTVKTQPTGPTQTCTVNNGTGTVSGANVTGVTVICSTNTYVVGGTVTGLAGAGLVLQNNYMDSLAITADGAFTFSTPVADGAGYNATVKAQPSMPAQICIITGGNGTVAGADVTTITVTCTFVPPDITPPDLVSTTPVDTTTGVAINTVITAVFSEAIDPATVTTTSVTLDQGGTPVTGTVQTSGNTISFTPLANLAMSMSYTATITAAVTDLAGNPLAGPISWSFTTAAAPPPPPGTLDTSFGTGGVVTLAFGSNVDEARAVAIQPDGRIVVGGDTDLSTGRLFAVARLLADGSLDPSFGTGGKVTTAIPGSTWDAVFGLAIQTDGKIVAAGGYSQFAVARYNVDGTLDASFGGTGVVRTNVGGGFWGAAAYSVALQTDGKIVAGGSHTLVRYNADGSLDTTFGTGGISQLLSSEFIRSLAIQPDGRIVAGGYAYNNHSTHDFALARFNADGTLDSTFGTSGTLTAAVGTNDICWAVRLQSDGKIIAAGETTSGGVMGFALIRFETNGALDPTFGNGGYVTTGFGSDGTAYGVAIQTDGHIVATGYAFNMGFALARYLPDGTLDATFGTGGKASTNAGGLALAYALALQGDGKIVAAGMSSTGGNDFAVARFWP